MKSVLDDDMTVLREILSCGSHAAKHRALSLWMWVSGECMYSVIYLLANLATYMYICTCMFLLVNVLLFAFQSSPLKSYYNNDFE